MGGTLVNRHEKNYSRERYQAMAGDKAEADRIASMLLAVSYSRRASPSCKSQSLIQKDCVAACFVNNTIWVASNSRQITPEDIDKALGEVYDGWDVYIVENGDGNMHAEMQLVQELKAERLTIRYIGVSKPCCLKCKQVLDEQEIDWCQYHGDKVVHWESPY